VVHHPLLATAGLAVRRERPRAEPGRGTLFVANTGTTDPQGRSRHEGGEPVEASTARTALPSTTTDGCGSRRTRTTRSSP
jgi:hypothetical protein